MKKPIVFISHITEEKELAIELKHLIEDSFLGMLEVFVSSDKDSVASGSRWLDNITDALKNCAIELILCSPESVKRPWINFEAGAGWVRGINVIPLCHSGMEVSKLPIPLNLLQAVKISEIPSLKLIFPVLATAIDAVCPIIAFDDFIDNVKQLEEKYTYWNKINNGLTEFATKYINIFNMLKKTNVAVDMQETEIRELREILNWFINKELIIIQETRNLSITPTGVLKGIEIRASEKYRNLFLMKECAFYED